jgi:hypothetical protein
VASKVSGKAITNAKVIPAVAIATVRQVSLATIFKNSASILGGIMSPKKLSVGFRFDASKSIQGLNSVATSIGQKITTKVSAQNKRWKIAGSRRVETGSAIDTAFAAESAPVELRRQ